MPRKYLNKKVVEDGHSFDSLAECRRYRELSLLAQGGAIQDLTVHPRYELQPKFRDNTGKAQPRILYNADFAYIEDGKKVVEDVKGGAVTTAFALKARLFKYIYRDIELRIIRP
jgi:hypothetical protein